MEVNKLFEEKKIDKGVLKPNDVIKFQIPLKKGINPQDQIEWIRTSCGGCTKAQLIGDKLHVTVNVAASGYDRYQIVDGFHNVTKSVYISLNDGRSEWIADPRTKEYSNNNLKEKETLSIVFKVKEEVD